MHLPSGLPYEVPVSDSELTQTSSSLDRVFEEGEASVQGRLARLELAVDQLTHEKVSAHGSKELSSRVWGSSSV